MEITGKDLYEARIRVLGYNPNLDDWGWETLPFNVQVDWEIALLDPGCIKQYEKDLEFLGKPSKKIRIINKQGSFCDSFI